MCGFLFFSIKTNSFREERACSQLLPSYQGAEQTTPLCKHRITERSRWQTQPLGCPCGLAMPQIPGSQNILVGACVSALCQGNNKKPDQPGEAAEQEHLQSGGAPVGTPEGAQPGSGGGGDPGKCSRKTLGLHPACRRHQASRLPLAFPWRIPFVPWGW